MSKLAASMLCLLVVVCATPRAADAQRLPPRRYEDRGACPFECCTYRRWTVKADTAFYRTRSTKSGVAFRARKGEHVTGLTGVVITVEPGEVVATGDLTVGDSSGRQVRVKEGDRLYLLNYTGEGFYNIWFRGKIYHDQPETAEEHAGRPHGIAARPYLRMVRRPETVWWMKVRNARGRVGWTRQNAHFDDVDACG